MTTTAEIITQAARNIKIEPDTRDGFHQVTPGVYWFTGCDLEHNRRVGQYYAIREGNSIRIETYR